MDTLELSPMERIAADIQSRREAAKEETTQTQETTTIAQNSEQTTENQTQETQTTQTTQTQEPEKPKTLSELVSHQPSPDELKEKELEQKILAKYQDKFQ